MSQYFHGMVAGTCLGLGIGLLVAAWLLWAFA